MDITNINIILQAQHIKEKKNHSICPESLVLFKLLSKVNLLKKKKIHFAVSIYNLYPIKRANSSHFQ